MQRAHTTIVALVGDRARELAETVGADTNARAVLPDAGDAPLDRARAVCAEAKRTHVPFLLHDADPLADIADAWAAYYDGSAPVGTVEVAVSETLARWRAGTLDLPDVYVVVDPEAIDATRRHFHLGFLHRRAPSRVVPAKAEPDAVRGAIAGWKAGRWWTDLDELLDGVERLVPDLV